MVAALPGLAIVGVKPLIVGVLEETTVKGWLLEAEPEGAVTVIGPVVAPTGTLVTISVDDDDSTVAPMPLNLTLFKVAVALNPVP
jgi:hypothetical protein